MDSEQAAVEEFFQLFKTPWEPYCDGHHYDVVISTSGDVSQVSAGLVLIFDAASHPNDALLGIQVGERLQDPEGGVENSLLPLYGEVLTLAGTAATPVLATNQGEPIGLRLTGDNRTTLRLGYNLFDQVAHLLQAGQPVARAGSATLDLHIELVRTWILESGRDLLELPPVPAGKAFMVCLTHDIDFVGIRRHLFDHTMWGFLCRSSLGALRALLGGRISLRRFLKIIGAAASLPLVYVGLKKDFWDPFEWYLDVEKDLPATYYLIPFKRRQGERVCGRHAARRGTAYDVTDIGNWIGELRSNQCEIGVHGIDAWHDADKGKEELRQIAEAGGGSSGGIRMHWLLQDEQTYRVLEEAGYAYDSTSGYNETIGFRNGTAQVFRPRGVTRLLELPMHIQDGALFFPQRLNLTDAEADRRCGEVIEQVARVGGVLTLLWHDRSHGPERYWGEFYARMVDALRSRSVWFGSGIQVVNWFESRRRVRFERIPDREGPNGIRMTYQGAPVSPPLTVRFHRAESKGRRQAEDMSWNGEPDPRIGEMVALRLSQAS